MSPLKRRAPEPEPATVIVKPGGKGTPTPKRREAQERRAQQVKGAPRSRKEQSARVREIRAETMAALKSTDPAKLPANERHPELVFARDQVDSRRNAASALLPLMLLYFAGTAVPGGAVHLVALLVAVAGFVVIGADTWYVARTVDRRVHERWPATNVRVRWYSARRMLGPKRWRRPVARPDVPPQNRWGARA